VRHKHSMSINRFSETALTKIENSCFVSLYCELSTNILSTHLKNMKSTFDINKHDLSFGVINNHLLFDALSNDFFCVDNLKKQGEKTKYKKKGSSHSITATARKTSSSSLAESTLLDQEQGGKEQEHQQMQLELVKLISNALELNLSFRNIRLIENLNVFSKCLSVLCLDNNRIEKICNLDSLVHLRR